MIEPIVVEFHVEASIDHAFSMWTERAALWWPRPHTISKADALDIVFEPTLGGRIFERTTAGDEHDWGEILKWDPPHSVAYLWFLFFDKSEGTDVEVSFRESAKGTTVRIRQSGFDRLGAAGQERRERTVLAWERISALYEEALDNK